MSNSAPGSEIEPSTANMPVDTVPSREVTPRSRRRRRRSGVVIGAVLVVAVGAATAAAITQPWKKEGTTSVRPVSDVTVAPVREGKLTSQVSQSGTLSYKAQADNTPYSVVNQAQGLFTAVPDTGDTIKCGQRLYRVDDIPIVLLCASKPAYRNLSEGDDGWDVRQLNSSLVKLGYADKSDLDPTSDHFGSVTRSALEDLQDDLGVDQTGELKLGDAVFLPGPLKVKKVTAKLGGRAGPGTQVLQATSTGREVTVDLNASQQSEVKVGDKAQITLPNNKVTSGVVDHIGTIADSSSGSGSSSSSGTGSSTATVPVFIRLKHPGDAGDLDQAPVQVQITTGGVDKALIVPVTALIGQAGGGYAVETVDAQGIHHPVPVTLGLFDDADGLVQVKGNLTAGQQVAVPRT